MNHSFNLWQLMGFAVTSLGGTILHFLYEWLGGAVWVAPFSGVNESTWEHMKLLFWPMLAFAAAQSFFFRDRRDFWHVKLCGILLGIALIPTIFYTCNGVVGTTPDWFNVAIFFISAATVYLFEAKLFAAEPPRFLPSGWSVTALCLLGGCFVLFTFVTPQIEIFRDPVSGAYGIG